jgi:hypothetical protein
LTDTTVDPLAPPAEASRTGGRARSAVVLARILGAWELVVLATAYLAIAPVVGVSAATAPTDEWIYVQAVGTLVHGHRLRVPDPAAMNLVFQTVWGGAFAAVFGLSFGALRLSTAVLVLLSGLALFRTVRLLGCSRPAATLATALYLFNPLALVLSWSFMTDASFCALSVIATWAFAEALHREPVHLGWCVAGSVVSACAFLVRQQGVVIPVAFLAWVVVRWAARPVRRLLVVSAAALAIPVLTAALFQWWLTSVNGVPAAQQATIDDVRAAGPSLLGGLALRLPVVALVWLGLFTAPLVVSGAVVVLRTVRDAGRASAPGLGWRVGLAGAFAGVSVVGAVVLAHEDHLMPYGGTWVTTWGLGPVDLPGGRPTIVSHGGQVVATVVGVAVVSLVAAAVVLGWRRSGNRTVVAGFLGFVLLAQLAGALPPSVPFRDVPTLDRYMLPLLAPGVALAVWATRPRRVALGLAWAVTTAMAAVGVLGVRDWLHLERAGWQMADGLVASGVDVTRVDAGGGWDGYHMYDLARAAGLHASHLPGEPGYVALWDLPTDPEWVVTATPIGGYGVAAERTVPMVLSPDAHLYLMHRGSVPG